MTSNSLPQNIINKWLADNPPLVINVINGEPVEQCEGCKVLLSWGNGRNKEKHAEDCPYRLAVESQQEQEITPERLEKLGFHDLEYMPRIETLGRAVIGVELFYEWREKKTAPNSENNVWLFQINNEHITKKLFTNATMGDLACILNMFGGISPHNSTSPTK